MTSEPITTATSHSTHPTYDVVVIGLGIMGASTLYHLSRAGLRVLGVDHRGPVHTAGSSHGQTRIFRRAYWEGERYVPLLNRSRAGWAELDDSSDDTLALVTGGLFIGHPGSTLIEGSHNTATRCGIDHEVLDAAEITCRFPVFHAHEDATAVYEPDALMLFAERARLSYVSHAVRHSARVVYGQSVRTLEGATAGSVTVAGDGWRASCGSAVLTTGGWMGELLPHEIGPVMTPMRIPVFEFQVPEARRDAFSPAHFPVFLFEDGDGSLVYGLPQAQGPGGVKIGFHNRQLTPVDMHAPRRPPTDVERLELWRAIAPLLPDLQSSGTGVACVYSMSADESFLIGPSSEIDGVHYVSACSGHGFKFAPGIGEALTQTIVDGRSDVDLAPFGVDRLRPRDDAGAGPDEVGPPAPAPPTEEHVLGGERDVALDH